MTGRAGAGAAHPRARPRRPARRRAPWLARTPGGRAHTPAHTPAHRAHAGTRARRRRRRRPGRGPARHGAEPISTEAVRRGGGTRSPHGGHQARGHGRCTCARSHSPARTFGGGARPAPRVHTWTEPPRPEPESGRHRDTVTRRPTGGVPVRTHTGEPSTCTRTLTRMTLRLASEVPRRGTRLDAHTLVSGQRLRDPLRGKLRRTFR